MRLSDLNFLEYYRAWKLAKGEICLILWLFFKNPNKIWWWQRTSQGKRDKMCKHFFHSVVCENRGNTFFLLLDSLKCYSICYLPSNRSFFSLTKFCFPLLSLYINLFLRRKSISDKQTLSVYFTINKYIILKEDNLEPVRPVHLIILDNGKSVDNTEHGKINGCNI